MTRLLYHAAQNEESVSPFDDAALQVARSGPLRIACPYIGVPYLKRIIGISGKWRLISDVQEWLASLSRLARPKAWQFVRENLEQIHHCPALHAKAVIGDRLAMMGSANLTRHGILGRTEMGILLDDPRLVAEMAAWFDDLWAETAPPIADEASAFIQWLDEEAGQSPARRQQFTLSSSSKGIRAKLVKLQRPAAPVAENNAPLNLAAVAQGIVAQDQKHYDSLEQAVEATLNELTAHGSFTLGDAVREVRQGFSNAEVREVYFLLLQYCANHVRSVFADTTQNRLILKDGRFSQSSRETLVPALVPFDKFLVYLIRYLGFAVARGLPPETRVERETGVVGRDQVILVSELLDCGLLGLQDIPGELPRYRLERDFEWEGRYQLFPQARAAWSEGKTRDNYAAPAAIPDDEDDSTWNGPIDQDSLPELIEGSDSSFTEDGLKRELQLANMAQRQLRVAKEVTAAEDRKERQRREAKEQMERQQVVDAWLADLLRQIAGGKVLEGVDFLDLSRSAANATGAEESLAYAVLDPSGRFPKVFSVRQKIGGSGWVLEINPGLSWDVLGNYPQTRAVCDELLATGR